MLENTLFNWLKVTKKKIEAKHMNELWVFEYDDISSNFEFFGVQQSK